MWALECITNWTGSGAENDANRPSLGDAYALHKWEDVTGQPSESLWPDPNLYIVRAECEADVLDAILADSNYYVLWAEELEDAAI